MLYIFLVDCIRCSFWVVFRSHCSYLETLKNYNYFAAKNKENTGKYACKNRVVAAKRYFKRNF